MKTTLKALSLSALLVAGFATNISANAATEIRETAYGFDNEPDGLDMALDALVARPVNAAVTALGAATWLVSLPFSMMSETQDIAAEKLMVEPADALTRCLGCTAVQDERWRREQYLKEQEMLRQGYQRTVTGAYVKQSAYGYQYGNSQMADNNRPSEVYPHH